jgi:hypothetical protein
MQGVRGSNPLSSTSRDPLWFAGDLVCSEVSRVPLGLPSFPQWVRMSMVALAILAAGLKSGGVGPITEAVVPHAGCELLVASFQCVTATAR